MTADRVRGVSQQSWTASTTTGRRPPIRLGETEAQFQHAVIELAQTLGWRVAHFRPARTSHGWRTPVQGDPGFPDLVMVRAGKIVFAELKSERGKLSADQQAWIDATGGYLWRPSDWRQIVAVLHGRDAVAAHG